jgi:hypothetical protein
MMFAKKFFMAKMSSTGISPLNSTHTVFSKNVLSKWPPEFQKLNWHTPVSVLPQVGGETKSKLWDNLDETSSLEEGCLIVNKYTAEFGDLWESHTNLGCPRPETHRVSREFFRDCSMPSAFTWKPPWGKNTNQVIE